MNKITKFEYMSERLAFLTSAVDYCEYFGKLGMADIWKNKANILADNILNLSIEEAESLVEI